MPRLQKTDTDNCTAKTITTCISPLPFSHLSFYQRNAIGYRYELSKTKTRWHPWNIQLQNDDARSEPKRLRATPIPNTTEEEEQTQGVVENPGPIPMILRKLLTQTP
jgi:hypothetical protein